MDFVYKGTDKDGRELYDVAFGSEMTVSQAIDQIIKYYKTNNPWKV